MNIHMGLSITPRAIENGRQKTGKLIYANNFGGFVALLCVIPAGGHVGCTTRN
jgi:hypothetical protein